MINSALIESLGSRENLILKLNGKEICTILKGQNSIWHSDVLSQERRSSKNRKTETGKKTRDFNAAGWRVLEVIMYRSNRSFNMPPPRAYPGHLTPLPSRGGGNLIIRVFQGWGIWSPCFRGGEIWAPSSISCKIFGVASNGGPSVRGFSWKRLYHCGQLATRKGLKQALWRIWSI